MSNEQKTPLARSLNQVAQNRALDKIQQLGKSLPCQVVSRKGSIVQVSFDINSGFTLPNVTIPIFGPQYIRYPLKPGCLGVTVAADARLGGVSGLGPGTAGLVQVPNLTALWFMPLGSSTFSQVDANTLVLYGEPNTLVQDKTAASTGVWSPDSIVLASNGHTLTISADGILLDGVAFAPHTHSGVQTGSGDTGPVVP